MAQYKVPQDVEADDKLLGPFTFRQFVYLLVVAGFVALGWGLWQIFPLLVIIPVPVILFFGVLALPLKKDQPMETYLAALVAFYLKPRQRTWEAGQAESTIEITAPKRTETVRMRDISGDEATNRLSFLAEIVDSEGRAIRNGGPVRDEIVAEASMAQDIFDASGAVRLEQALRAEAAERRAETLEQMRAAIQRADAEKSLGDEQIEDRVNLKPLGEAGASIVTPTVESLTPAQSTSGTLPSAGIIDLANNNDFSVETLARQAKRLNEQRSGEVYVDLH